MVYSSKKPRDGTNKLRGRQSTLLSDDQISSVQSEAETEQPLLKTGFILLGGSPYWSSTSRSYLVCWSIRSSNQSDLSCLSSSNLLSSILIFNISCKSLFIISHSPFMYFRLSELGVVKFFLHLSGLLLQKESCIVYSNVGINSLQN